MSNCWGPRENEVALDPIYQSRKAGGWCWSLETCEVPAAGGALWGRAEVRGGRSAVPTLTSTASSPQEVAVRNPQDILPSTRGTQEILSNTGDSESVLDEGLVSGSLVRVDPGRRAGSGGVRVRGRVFPARLFSSVLEGLHPFPMLQLAQSLGEDRLIPLHR